MTDENKGSDPTGTLSGGQIRNASLALIAEQGKPVSGTATVYTGTDQAKGVDGILTAGIGFGPVQAQPYVSRTEQARRGLTPDDLFPTCTPGVRAVGVRVLVQLYKLPEVTQGGIIIPAQVNDVDKKFVTVGKVIDVGPAAFLNYETGTPRPGAPWYGVGDYVLVPRSKSGDIFAPIEAQTDARLKDVQFCLFQDETIYAVIAPEAVVGHCL